MIYGIIIFVLFIIICILYKKTKDIHKYNQDIDCKNKELEKYSNELLQSIRELEKEEIADKLELNAIQDKIENAENAFKILSANLSNQDAAMEQQKKICHEAFSNYVEVLDKEYQVAEISFDEKLKELENDFSYSAEQLKAAIQKEKDELDKIRSTRAAAQEALIREEEIKADLSFYCLIPSKKELQDYDKINSLRPMLNDSRILSMLLWQTYFQPLAKKQFPLILGKGTKMGIYKITNQLTNQSYIGQSVDVDKRWKDHCKCGLGIDTPAGNKLYKAMEKDGLQNFSFELLEECSREELDEKEKYYIELYQAYEFGYNSTVGNSKNRRA